MCCDRALAIGVTGRVEINILSGLVFLATCVLMNLGGLVVLGVLCGGESMRGF